MKPLSARKYFKRNKKSMISSLLVVVLAMTLIYSISNFVEAMEKTNYNVGKMFLNEAQYINSKEGEIEDKIILEFKENENVEKVIPYTNTLSISFSTVGNINYFPIYGFSEEDRNYIIKKYDIKVSKGRLPENHKKEIAIDSNVAINNKLEIGDIYEKYEVVGILESNIYLSIKPYTCENEANLNDSIKNILIFAKEGKYDLVGKNLEKDNNYYCSDINKYTEKYNDSSKEVKQIFNSLIIFIIIVNVITLACIKYAQFLNRKNQYGVLNAIGYNKKEIIYMALKEVILINIMGSILGFIIAFVINKLLVDISFTYVGGTAVYITVKSIILSLLIPVFTAIFTLIPIFRSLNNMDTMSLIGGEENGI